MCCACQPLVFVLSEDRIATWCFFPWHNGSPYLRCSLASQRRWVPLAPQGSWPAEMVTASTSSRAKYESTNMRMTAGFGTNMIRARNTREPRAIVGESSVWEGTQHTYSRRSRDIRIDVGGSVDARHRHADRRRTMMYGFGRDGIVHNPDERLNSPFPPSTWLPGVSDHAVSNHGERTTIRYLLQK